MTMSRYSAGFAAAVLLLLESTNAFIVAPTTPRVGNAMAVRSFSTLPTRSQVKALYASSEEQSEKDNEIERLKAQAAKLRAEALALEADRAKELADAAERAFAKFDTNKDGEISLQELKEGLEKTFKMELPEKRVKKLMEDFDTSGDGALQLEEFKGVDQFRNRLEALAFEEKRAAAEAEKTAKMEAEMAKFLEASMAMINDKEPTGTEKLVSVLPYLFPLLDGLQFGRFLVIENADNPLVAIVAILFALYKSVPFGGFIAFFALNFLSTNPGINKLIRFNMQQAIFLDIFLFFPGLLAALYAVVVQGVGGVQIPPAVTEIGSDAVFFTLLVAIGYATVSSLLGQTPDKIPVIGKLVADRMPQFEVDMSMMDPKMRMTNREEKKKDENKDKED